MAIWSRALTFITGGAVARASSDAVSPVLEPVRQTAWKNNQLRVLDPTTAARLRVQGLITDAAAEEEAGRSGISPNRLAAIEALLQTAPGLSELIRLVNREHADRADFEQAMAKHEIPPKWWAGLWDLRDERLDPAQSAAAIHRGLIPDPGLLKGEQPSGPRNVESYPVYPIDAIEQARAYGYDRDKLGVLVGLQGLPMGPHEAAQALFRGIITHGDYIAAFNESNNRNEWANAVLEQTRQIPTARDFFENALRGYHSLEWAQEQAKRHGMSDADSLVIYQNQGRPMNIRAAQQALARGAKFHPEPGELTDVFDAIVVEGNLKPAYYEMAKSLRYTYPSPFVLRSLAQSGAITEQQTEEVLLYEGWEPTFAAKVAAAWAGGTTAGADKHVASAQTRLITTTHSSYVKDRTDDATATDALVAAGVNPSSVPDVLALWRIEAEIVRGGLSAAQIKKAYRETRFTLDEAVARLVELGWSVADANTYLAL